MRKRASKSKKREPKNLESGQESLYLAAENEEQVIADNKTGKQGNGNQTLTTDSHCTSPDSMTEAGKLEQGNKGVSPRRSSPVAEAKVSLDNGATKSEKKKRNRSKGLDLPRRTSKRLAGIEVDISLETTVRTRSRPAAGRQISEVEDSDSKKCENVANSDEHGERLGTKKEADLKPESLDVLPQGDSNVSAENPNIEVTECKADDKGEVPFGLPLSELWKDPCIEFAIKTLTGTIPIGEETKPTMNAGASSNVSGITADPCQDLPPMNIWSDPCFEFAVKTLTGDLPLVTDPALEALLKKPAENSAPTEEQNGSTVPGLKSGGSFRQCNTADGPQTKQQR